MNKQIKTAVCPVCHGTGCIGTTDWLTKGIDKEKLAKEREEALAEYEAQKKRDLAREIFAEIARLLDDCTVIKSFDYGKPYFAISKFKNRFAELKKKYESEG